MNLRSLVPFRTPNGGRSDVNIFGSFHREIDRLFDDFASTLTPVAQQGTTLMPRIDVSETDKEIEITAELPGLERDDVEISLDDDILTIRGEKRMEEKEGDEKKNYHVTERTYGVFLRVLELPPGVDPSTVEATMSNGILRIRIPKPGQSEARKIEVKEETRAQGSNGSQGSQGSAQSGAQGAAQGSQQAA